MSADRSLQILLDELGRLPGIGPKSAQRIAYHLLEADVEEARRLADAILMVKNEVHFAVGASITLPTTSAPSARTCPVSATGSAWWASPAT